MVNNDNLWRTNIWQTSLRMMGKQERKWKIEKERQQELLRNYWHNSRKRSNRYEKKNESKQYQRYYMQSKTEPARKNIRVNKIIIKIIN